MSSSPVRRYIQEQHKVRLPLGGGDGSSAAQAIILTDQYTYPDLFIKSMLDYYHDARELEWEMGKHSEFRRKGRIYDKYEVIYTDGTKQPFYFDTTLPKQSTYLPDTKDYLKQARYLIRQHKLASPSLLQRKMKIGYARATLILEKLGHSS